MCVGGGRTPWSKSSHSGCALHLSASNLCPQARLSRPAAKSEFLRVATSDLRASLQHYRERVRPSRPVGRGGQSLRVSETEATRCRGEESDLARRMPLPSSRILLR